MALVKYLPVFTYGAPLRTYKFINYTSSPSSLVLKNILDSFAIKCSFSDQDV